MDGAGLVADHGVGPLLRGQLARGDLDGLRERRIGGHDGQWLRRAVGVDGNGDGLGGAVGVDGNRDGLGGAVGVDGNGHGLGGAVGVDADAVGADVLRDAVGLADGRVAVGADVLGDTGRHVRREVRVALGPDVLGHAVTRCRAAGVTALPMAATTGRATPFTGSLAARRATAAIEGLPVHRIGR